MPQRAGLRAVFAPRSLQTNRHGPDNPPIKSGEGHDEEKKWVRRYCCPAIVHRFARLALLIGAIAAATPAVAQAPDLVLLDGKIVTLDAASSLREAIALRDGKIVALGTTAEMRALAGPGTRRVELAGRTVIPGLIDSHMHAIRAGLTFGSEVSWIGTRSLDEALGRIRDAAQRIPPGQWIIVAGGWTDQQFAEKRRPTQAELIAAAPDHPVYVQLSYRAVLLTPHGLRALALNDDADAPPRGRFERDAEGNRTGWINGDSRTIIALFDRLPKPDLRQAMAGTKAYFRELNRLGLTGALDPGGHNLAPEDYAALFALSRQGALTLRVSYSLFAPRAGHELEDFQTLTRFLPMGMASADGMLRFNGIGECVTWDMYNNDNPTEAQKNAYYEVALWAAVQGMTLTQHWGSEKSVAHLLEVFERVNAQVPIAPLRWSIAHLHDMSPTTLARMKALGIGWLMQDGLYFAQPGYLQTRGAEALSTQPAIVSALRLGVPVGGGTDAHRVMSYNPFVALQWMLDGRTVAGVATRGASETPTREQALRLYTLGSAWFAHEDGQRGSLEAGKLADLAVLSDDYFAVPVERIGAIQSLLTLVGGQAVYGAGPYADLAAQEK